MEQNLFDSYKEPKLKEKDYEKGFPYIKEGYNSPKTENIFRIELERRENFKREFLEEEKEEKEFQYDEIIDFRVIYEDKEVEHSKLYPKKETQISKEYFNFINEKISKYIDESSYAPTY